jgi:DNA-nicking Smr family endonuclease
MARKAFFQRPIDASILKIDDELFRRAVSDVRRLRHKKHVIQKPKPPARARFRRADEQNVLRESLDLDPAQLETGDEIAFRRADISVSVLRKLRAGNFLVEAELDLHGLNAATAAQILRDFLAQAIGENMRCVRIIHGKGRRSGPGGPVLKNLVNDLLRKLDAVSALASARPVDGGTGAVYVLLRR